MIGVMSSEPLITNNTFQITSRYYLYIIRIHWEESFYMLVLAWSFASRPSPGLYPWTMLDVAATELLKTPLLASYHIHESSMWITGEPINCPCFTKLPGYRSATGFIHGLAYICSTKCTRVYRATRRSTCNTGAHWQASSTHDDMTQKTYHPRWHVFHSPGGADSRSRGARTTLRTAN